MAAMEYLLDHLITGIYKVLSNDSLHVQSEGFISAP